MQTIFKTLALVFMLLGPHAYAAPVGLILDAHSSFAPPPDLVGGADIRYDVQPAKEGKIDLTPNNGFFDQCFRAAVQGKVIPGDEPFTYASYDHLRRFRDIPGQARWHLWIDKAGEFEVAFYMTVPESDAGEPWTIRIGDQTQVLVARQSDSDVPQKTLVFNIDKPGKYEMMIDCTDRLPAANTLIHVIQLRGQAMMGAKLIRSFRRPMAKHVGFKAPESCVAPMAWVFEVEQVTGNGFSFSPISTPFGYFGTQFNHDGKVAAGSSYNFSMWIGKSDAPKAPPNEQLPMLLATAVPGATFGYFGTEGNGVKLRGAAAYPDGAERAIQAMRMEYADGYHTFYGYFYNEAEDRWVLFAAGKRPLKPHWKSPSRETGYMPRRTGSFVEVPGAAGTQRSGDVVRIVRRRGWFLDADRMPHRAEMEVSSLLVPGHHYSVDDIETVIPPRTKYMSQRAYYMEDFAAEGWIATTVGGVERHRVAADISRNHNAPEAKPRPLPAYLQPEKLKQLYELPFKTREPKASDLTDHNAIVTYPVAGSPDKRKAMLYYGTRDSLTYPQKDVTGRHAEPAIKDLHGPDRGWQHEAEPSTAEDGSYTFTLKNLKPNTTYYYRLYLEGEAGKQWSFQTHTFKTSQPID